MFRYLTSQLCSLTHRLMYKYLQRENKHQIRRVNNSKKFSYNCRRKIEKKSRKNLEKNGKSEKKSIKIGKSMQDRKISYTFFRIIYPSMRFIHEEKNMRMLVLRDNMYCWQPRIHLRTSLNLTMPLIWAVFNWARLHTRRVVDHNQSGSNNRRKIGFVNLGI